MGFPHPVGASRAASRSIPRGNGERKSSQYARGPPSKRSRWFMTRPGQLEWRCLGRRHRGEAATRTHQLRRTGASTLHRVTRRYHRPNPESVLGLHLREGNDDLLARSHWTSTLELIDPRFYPTFIKPAGTGHRKNNLKHGVCRVSMTKSTDAFHRTMAWIDAIADFPGASRR